MIPETFTYKFHATKGRRLTRVTKCHILNDKREHTQSGNNYI